MSLKGIRCFIHSMSSRQRLLHSETISSVDNFLGVQAFVDVELMPEYTNIRCAVRHVIQTQGVMALWAGFLPRLIRLSGATIILQVVRNKMIEFLEPDS